MQTKGSSERGDKTATAAAPMVRRSRLRLVLALSAVVIVVVSALWAWSQRGRGDAADASPAAAAMEHDDEPYADDDDAIAPAGAYPATVGEASRIGRATMPRAPDLPPADLPPREAVAQLLPLVERGRADATHALAMNLVRCQRGRALRGDERIRDGQLRRFRWRNGRDPASDAELDGIAREIERQAAERERCAGLDDALYASRLDLLEKAALAGNTDAMLDYADWGLQDIDGYNSLLRNFDEVGRRRTLAAGFLQRALSLGDCRALAVLADAYSGDRGRRIWITRADAYLATVYTQASTSVQGAFSSAEQAQRWNTLAEARAQALDPARLDAARRQAAQIVQRHCTR